jgi:hypothetical protein
LELLVFWIVMAVICGMVASSKNRSFFAYFFGGLLLWPIVLVAAILAKPKTDIDPAVQAAYDRNLTEWRARDAEWRGQQAAIEAARAPVAASSAPPPVFAATGSIAGLPARFDGVGVVVRTASGDVGYPTVAAAERTLGAPYQSFT